MSDGSPPQRPPQISPDGKWVWDGSEWQPVAGRDSGHTGVFPAFSSASRLDPGLAVQTQPAQMPFPGPPPAANYSVNYGAPQTNAAPLWQVKPGHWNKYLYVVAGIVVLVMAGIFLNSIGPISLPFFGGSQQATQTPAPSLLSTRTDFAAADRFVKVVLVPTMTSFNQTVSTQMLSCNGVLTVGCQSALIETDNQVKNAIAAVNAAPAPLCIAPNVAKLKIDLAGVDAFLENGLAAYSRSSKSGLASALAGFIYEDRLLQTDILAALKAHTIYCDTQLTGP